MRKKLIIPFIAFLCFVVALCLSLFVFGEDEKAPTTDEVKKKQNYVVTGDETVNRAYYSFATCEGVDTTGETDMTELLQSFINKNHSVFIPKGDYRIDGQIYLYSGYALDGEDGTVIHTSGNTPFDIICETVGDVFLMAGNIHLSDFAVYSSVVPEDASHPYVVTGANIYNTTIENINVKNIGITYLTSYMQHGFEDFAECQTRNILIRNCEGDGGNMGELSAYLGAYGVNVLNIREFKIENCRFTNYLHGVQFMGGAGYFGHFEDLDALRCCNGEIVGCVMDYMGGAGVWGDMSTNVNVYDCTISHCDDFGIDFEASNNCEAIGNTVSDCSNNFGTFHRICGHIEFKYNTSIQSKDSQYTSHYQHCNYTESPSLHTEVIFENNTFIGGKQSFVAITNYYMPFNNIFVFRNNKCKNTFIVPAYINPKVTREYSEMPFDVHKVTITDNTFDFDNLVFTYEYAVYIGARPLIDDGEPDVLIENNVINVEKTNLGGIMLYTPHKTENTVNKNPHGEHDNTLTAVIKGNKIIGSDMGIHVLNELEGLTVDLKVENNIFENGLFDGALKYNFGGNRKNDGSELTEDDVIIVSKLYTPNTKGKSGEIITTASMLPNNVGISLDGVIDIIWCSAESESITKKIGNSVRSAKLRTLWEDVGERIALYLLVEVDKGETINRKDILRISFAPLSGAKSSDDAYTYEFNIAGTVISDNLHGAYTIPETRTSEVIELKLYIDKDSELYNEIIKDNKIGFNVEYAPNGKYENAVGWASASENVTANDFGTLVFGDKPKQKLSTDALYGDVNGDGKIKGNDSTLLLKYLAGWNVTINEVNADCNGDGKIKGNDSTLLLKYLAGWDVSLG